MSSPNTLISTNPLTRNISKTFRTINELVEKNQELLHIIREQSFHQTTAEKQVADETIRQVFSTKTSSVLTGSSCSMNWPTLKNHESEKPNASPSSSNKIICSRFWTLSTNKNFKVGFPRLYRANSSRFEIHKITRKYSCSLSYQRNPRTSSKQPALGPWIGKSSGRKSRAWRKTQQRHRSIEKRKEQASRRIGPKRYTTEPGA